MPDPLFISLFYLCEPPEPHPTESQRERYGLTVTQTIYIWLGIAGLIGCIAGAAIFLVFKILTSALHIDGAADHKARAKGRTIREYRATRREKREISMESSSGPTVVRLAGPRRHGLSSQAIIEEESDF